MSKVTRIETPRVFGQQAIQDAICIMEVNLVSSNLHLDVSVDTCNLFEAAEIINRMNDSVVNLYMSLHLDKSMDGSMDWSVKDMSTGEIVESRWGDE